MKKQTAVEWLIETMTNSAGMDQQQIDKVFEQAKQLERQQIEDAYDEDLYGGLSGRQKFINGSDYFTQTYEQ